MGYVFHFEVPMRQLPVFLLAALQTLRISGLGILIGLAISIFGALGRMSKNKVIYVISTAYVEFIRNTPFLVQLFIIYFGLPSIGLQFTANTAALIALSINCGAYCTEVVRAGIESIRKGQIDAGLSLGMSYMQVFRHVILFPALKAVFPPLGNVFIITMLGSSAVAIISAQELTYAGSMLESRTFRSFEIFTVITVIYFILAQILAGIFKVIELKVFKRTERRIIAQI